MSLQSVEKVAHRGRVVSRRRGELSGNLRVPTVAPVSPRVLAPSTLTVVSDGVTRWYDPSAQHVTWRLRITNTGETPLSELTASFDYAGSCGTPATALSVCSRSTRRNVLTGWSRVGELATVYRPVLAAWETLVVTAVFTGVNGTRSGSVASTFAAGGSGDVLGVQSDVF